MEPIRQASYAGLKKSKRCCVHLRHVWVLIHTAPLILPHAPAAPRGVIEYYLCKTCERVGSVLEQDRKRGMPPWAWKAAPDLRDEKAVRKWNRPDLSEPALKMLKQWDEEKK